MKLERLNYNKLKIYLTYDDLFENGLTVEDIKNDGLKVHGIIQSMVESACAEVDFQMVGTIQIEIFTMHNTQGLVMIVTRENDSDSYEDELLDLQVFLEEQQQLLYIFDSFEDLVQLCKVLKNKMLTADTSVYYYNDCYYLQIANAVAEKDDTLSAILQEYGSLSTLSIFVLMEYGKEIIKDNAVQKIEWYFMS
ncbi:MAG: adaptor protein MecA [Bacillus sp. (in: firmicutes)]